MMGRRGGGLWGRSKFAAAGRGRARACRVRERAARDHVRPCRREPPPARGLRAQIRVGQPTATANLDSDRILVRESDTLATLEGARWSELLPSLFRTRLAQSFQNAGLARWIDGPAATADDEVDLDIRAFELDAETKEVHVDVAAWIVSLGSGRIRADQIFTLRAPVASTDAADVAAAMDQVASTVMTDIVKFVARAL